MSVQGETRAGIPGKSWVVRKAGGKWQLVKSYWTPGYTPAHTESQGDAKRQALANLEAQLAVIQQGIQEVKDLPFICESGCDDALPYTVDPECPVHGWV